MMFKASKQAIIAISFVLVIGLFNLSAPKADAAIQHVYYVSPDGNDSNSGTLAQPFKTITKARNMVRTINGNMTGDIEVRLLPGDYNLDSTLEFNENDSGTNGHQIIYKNQGALGSARIIGGTRITNWELHTGGIYKSNVGMGLDLQALYEDDMRAVIARRPNAGYFTMTAQDSSMPKRKFQYKSGDLPAMSDYDDLKVYVWSGGHNWDTNNIDVRAVNFSTRWVTLEKGAKRNLKNSRYYFQDALDLLDAPGEFYYDTSTGWLYYRPYSGSVTGHAIVAPKLKVLVNLEGSSESALVQNITFEGLTFTSTNYDNNYTGNETGNIRMTNAAHNTVKYCRILNAGFSAVHMPDYAQYNTVYGNEIKNIGTYGIILRGSPRTLLEINKGHLISNNHIEGVGKLEGFAAGVYMANSGYNEVSYNDISQSPRYGISVKGTAFSAMASEYEGVPVTYANHWDFNPGRYNVIKFNHVYKVNQDSQDTGAIEMWGPGKYNIVDNNRIHDSGSFGIQSGLYLDDDTSYTTVTNNIIYSIKGGSKVSATIKGVYNTLSNNIFDYSNGGSGIRSLEYGNDASNNQKLDHNIFYVNGGATKALNFSNYAWNRVNSSDYNIFFHTSGTYQVAGIPGADTLANWKTRNSNQYDQHSITANPLFVDRANRDYTLQASSPALAKGFQQIDQSSIGLKSDYPYTSDGGEGNGDDDGDEGGSLTAHWAFEDDLADSSGNGMTGTYHNASFDDGRDGQAIVLNGTNAYASVPHQAELTLGAPSTAFTLTAWINTSSTAAVLPIVAKSRPNAVTNMDYIFELSNGKLRLRRWHESPNSTEYVYDSDGAAINDGTWHFVSFVNGGASDHRLYIDGELVEESSETWTYNDSNNQPLEIGRFKNYTYNTIYFAGSIDDVILYPTARTDAEISDQYNAY